MQNDFNMENPWNYVSFWIFYFSFIFIYLSIRQREVPLKGEVSQHAHVWPTHITSQIWPTLTTHYVSNISISHRQCAIIFSFRRALSGRITSQESETNVREVVLLQLSPPNRIEFAFFFLGGGNDGKNATFWNSKFCVKTTCFLFTFVSGFQWCDLYWCSMLRTAKKCDWN